MDSGDLTYRLADLLVDASVLCLFLQVMLQWFYSDLMELKRADENAGGAENTEDTESAESTKNAEHAEDTVRTGRLYWK